MKEFFTEYALEVLLCGGTAFSMYWLWKQRSSLRLTMPAAVILAVLHTFAGVAAVKLFAVLETLDLDTAGAMSLFGAIFFLPLLYWGGAQCFKRSVVRTFDVFTPCMVVCIMVARINCMLSGCCLGKYIPGHAPLRWPTRELEVVFYIIIIVWILRREKTEHPPGYIYPIYMMSYGALRFVLESFREADSSSVLHLAHLWAAICCGLGLSFYFEFNRKMTRRRQGR